MFVNILDINVKIGLLHMFTRVENILQIVLHVRVNWNSFFSI